MNDEDFSAAMVAVDSYAVNHDERRQARQAIRLSNAQAVVSALERAEHPHGPGSTCLTCRESVVWKAEVARLQGDA